MVRMDVTWDEFEALYSLVGEEFVRLGSRKLPESVVELKKAQDSYELMRGVFQKMSVTRARG